MSNRKHFSEHAQHAMQFAESAARELGSDYIGTEHVLMGLAHEVGSTAEKMLAAHEAPYAAILNAVQRMIGGMPLYPSDHPHYTPRVKRVLQGAYEEAQFQNSDTIGTEHLLIALLRETEGAAADILASLGIDGDAFFDEVSGAYPGNGEGDGAEDGDISGKRRQRSRGNRPKGTGYIAKFSRDLTELAKSGGMDPVIGRETEIARVIQILARRTKNNPILLGEPGVGKTAIAEGLAERIAEGSVPYMLQNKRVVTLSLASLVAGAKYRGEFEERMKNVIEEVTQAKDIILFIDEIHTLIGAGSGEGSLDAANILKPALSRGEVQIIGATTLDEYKKYLEKDAALSRRFQTILVEEPKEEEAKRILEGLRGKYEAFHKAKILDSALDAAVKLSHRYITDRFLPDKSIDLMDEAASKVRMRRVAQPEKMKKVQAEINAIREAKDKAVAAQDFERAAALRDDEKQAEGRLQAAKEEWEKRGESRIIVTEDDIADVVSQWTGIPVRQIAAKESQRLLHMEKLLGKRVIGQDAGVKAVAKAVRRARAGLKDPKRPIGSFLFLGPTGVGKTELAKTLSKTLFGTEDAIIRFDMSEYLEKYAVSRMVGAPPGYVGYEEGGQLTDAVRKKPYSIILLDEIEKAHPDVFNILLQVLDDGRLTDGKGRTVDFRNTVIIMTSNAGSNLLKKEKSAMGFATSTADAKKEAQSEKEKARARVLAAVKKIFKPEFLNRVDELVVFDPLDRESLGKIVDILLGELKERLAEKSIRLEVTPAAKDTIVTKGTDFKFGARPLKRAIQKQIEDSVAERLLAKEFVTGDTIQVRKADGRLIFVKKDTPKEKVRKVTNAR